MATGAEVLAMLIPEGGWVIVGDDFDGIQFLECEPITKAKFQLGFAEIDAWKAEQELSQAANKQAILDRLGITAEEAALLLQ
jgi:hypothetical protein